MKDLSNMDLIIRQFEVLCFCVLAHMQQVWGRGAKDCGGGSVMWCMVFTNMPVKMQGYHVTLTSYNNNLNHSININQPINKYLVPCSAYKIPVKPGIESHKDNGKSLPAGDANPHCDSRFFHHILRKFTSTSSNQNV